MKAQLKVGVSVFVRKAEQSLWENGVVQNCLFLVTLLVRSPRVSQAYLVVGEGGGDPHYAARFLSASRVPVIDMLAAAQELDLMIEMSAQLTREWVIEFRARGGKIVSMRVGNDYVIDIERMLFDKPHGLLVTAAPYHEVWTLPEYEATCVSYFASIFRTPVRTLPHLWSPMLLNRAVAQRPSGQSFQYEPGRGRWRVAIFEPNICMVKTCWVPLLSCESAHRAAPNLIERVLAFNTLHMKEHPSYMGFVNSLDIVRHGLVSFEGRTPIWQMMPACVDAVISHHWENGQNYLYYEALHGGYPLIHNSHLIGDCGYRYRDFDCEEGGLALCRAFAQHDAELSAYRDRARKFLATLDPESEVNVRDYTAAIERLYSE